MWAVRIDVQDVIRMKIALSVSNLIFCIRHLVSIYVLMALIPIPHREDVHFATPNVKPDLMALKMDV